jgi:hypothetical protein
MLGKKKRQKADKSRRVNNRCKFWKGQDQVFQDLMNIIERKPQSNKTDKDNVAHMLLVRE